MDKPELLAEFKAQLEQFETYQTHIDKARNYADRFNPMVVQKVIEDKTASIVEVAGVLDPLVAQMREVIAGLESDRQEVQQGGENARMTMEELELRLAIGEYDQDQFDSESAALKEALESADDKTSAIDDELESFRTALSGWIDSRPDFLDAAHDEDDLLGELEEDEGVELEADDEEDLLAFEDDGGRGGGGDEGVHNDNVNVVDDVSAVFEEDGSSDEAEPEVAIEAAPDDDEGISFAADEIEDLGDDLRDDAAESSPAADASGEGTAVLILGEGTAEEHVYPFTGDVLSLGRGRDNNVQVKNDSKVSRYHCKLFKRTGSYYIEDNKSANGTLVDGELVTEKRLIGGEEIIIGETFFRFQIQH